MKNSKRTLFLFSIVAIQSSMLAVNALAANPTWNGGGTDANWSTGDNWGGTAPVNSDNLAFNGTIRQNNTNDIGGLIIGSLTFNNGGFVLNGGNFRINGTSTAFITNAAGLNIISNDLTFGSAVAKYWFVAPNSEVRLTGVVSNTAATGTSIGWLNLTNGGTVRIMNSAKSVRGMDLFQGTVIVDGSSALVDASNDGIVFKPPTGSTVNVVLTNNGTIRIGGGGNFRMGNGRTGLGAPAGSGSTSVVDMSSGLLEIYGAAVNVYVGDNVSGATGIFNQNGGLVWGSAGSGNAVTIGNTAGADGTYNLNGGTLWIAQVRQGNAGAANAVFNFNGGTLKPTASSTTFMQGLQTVNVQGGGAIIDTTNFDVTIGQSLQAGTSSGGLTKLGTGTLTLTGYNYYLGNTIVSNGTLVISTDTLLGGGSLSVADGAKLSITNNGALTLPALTLGSASAVQFNFPNSSPGFATITASTLTANGSVTVNITGQGLSAGTFPLIQSTSATGLGNFHLGTVPPGVSATLVTDATTVSLNISSVVKSLEWNGSDGQWDTTSINWLNLGNGGNPASYAQSGGFGDQVKFDGLGSANVNLTLAVTPVSITVNDDSGGNYYTIGGAGKISGIGQLNVNASQPLVLATVNDFSGGTIINNGYVFAGADEALGSGPVTMSAGQLCSDSITARTLTNVVTQTADTGVIFGDLAQTGPLTLGGLNLGGGSTRTLLINSDVILNGSVTNGSFNTKDGNGTLVIKGNSQQAAVVDQIGGDVIIDGTRFDNSNGWRLWNKQSGTTMRLVVTNGGTFTINIVTANLRLGQAGGDNGASTVNLLDVAGTVDMTPTGAVGANSSVTLGASGGSDIFNLRSTGNVLARAIVGNSSGTPPAITEAHFYGGTLTAIANESAFITGLTNAYMENGGLIIDTTNFSVIVPQALVASGSGGLTKVGSGTLTLTGANTYNGTTVVNAGKLVLAPAHAASGVITVNANSTLAFSQPSALATVYVPSVTIGAGANSALEAELAGTNAPAGIITNLTLNGAVAVNVSGPIAVGQFPLFGYVNISGPGSLTLGQLPQGTIGHLVTNTLSSPKTIDLVVSAIANVVWTGAANGNWDTITTNWSVLGVPTAYAQLANVQFDDSASNPTINLATTVTPSSILISNSALSYQFSGPGAIGGNMNLTKSGTNSLTVSTANTFSGKVTVNAGTFVFGNAAAAGSSANSVYATNTGALDINGTGLGLQPIVLSGNGQNGTGALVNFGGDQNDALRNVTLAGDTTIGGIAVMGLRTSADSDPGLVANGHKLIKTGTGQINLNGGQVVAGLTNVWFTDIGDIDIQQGTLSFQRRSALGRTNNTITIEPAATLLLFSLNQDLPVPMNNIVMTNGILQGTGVLGTINTLGGQITVNGLGNSIGVQQWSGATGPTLLYVNGPIVGSGGVSYDASANTAIIQLAGTNTYTGATVITNGTLVLAATGKLTGTPSISVASGATFDVSAASPWTLGSGQTLAGYGTINGSVQANGTVAPGGSIGTLTFNNDLALAGTNIMELNKDSGLTNDMLTVNGTLTFGGRLNVILTGATPLAVNDTFKLFNFVSPPGGSFSISLPAGYAWDTTQLAVDGTIKVTGVTSAPSIGSVVISGGNLTLTGTGGPAGGSYHVLSSTNLALPLASWPSVSTGSFASNGNFTNTLPVLVSEPRRFYTVSVP